MELLLPFAFLFGDAGCPRDTIRVLENVPPAGDGARALADEVIKLVFPDYPSGTVPPIGPEDKMMLQVALTLAARGNDILRIQAWDLIQVEFDFT